MGFAIHALPVLAGELAISPVPGTDDVATIANWRPSHIVSLITDHEARVLALPPLDGQGARWWHLPIADFGTPDAENAARWNDLSATLLAALADGQRVLIHCRGGCGRSGMIALRLMIAAGEAPDAALARLRAARPCAVETPAQMAWAVATGAP